TLDLHPAELATEPGQLVRCELRLRNTGDRVDGFTLEVTGEAGGWAWTNPPSLRLAPGAEGKARALFRPPVGSRSAAGRHPFTVRVVPASRPDDAVEVDGSLHIGAVLDLHVVLRPRSPSTRRSGTYALVVENRGNAPARSVLRPAGDPGRNQAAPASVAVLSKLVALFAAQRRAPAPRPLLRSPTRSLRLRVEPTELTVEPGGVAEARVEVRGGRPLLWGKRQHDVSVEVAAESGPPFTATTTAVSGAMLPRGGVALAALGLLAATVFLLRSALPGASGDDPAANSGARSGESAEMGTLACPAEGHRSPSGVVQIDDGLRPVGERGRPPPRDYAFLLAGADGCSPVRFNACEPVHYAINPDLAPSAEALNDVHEAIARLAEASGLRFVFDGPSDETFMGNWAESVRPPYQPDRYGERWVPLLVAWTSGGFAPPEITGPQRIIAGGGLPTVVGDVIVTGQVALNADAVLDLETRKPLPAGFGPGITWGRVLLHELGHAVGLGHVSGPTQLMHEPLTDHPPAPPDYAAGDRAGLALIGRELQCLGTPPLPARLR
ncbi:MAG: hypothetical protein M3N52_10675, partial [Actinomycetota bacterium]|nr:hypothetical protein [Actinomycetota bacterium]